MSDKFFSFKSSERIKSSKDFKKAYRYGKRFYTETLIIFIIKNKLDSLNRLGVVVSKKVGKSVTRNHWKRRIREFYRHNKNRFGKSVDVVVVIKREAKEMHRDNITECIKHEMELFFKKYNT